MELKYCRAHKNSFGDEGYLDSGCWNREPFVKLGICESSGLFIEGQKIMKWIKTHVPNYDLSNAHDSQGCPVCVRNDNFSVGEQLDFLIDALNKEWDKQNKPKEFSVSESSALSFIKNVR